MEPVTRLRVMLNTRSSLNMPGTFGSGPLRGGSYGCAQDPGDAHLRKLMVREPGCAPVAGCTQLQWRTDSPIHSFAAGVPSRTHLKRLLSICSSTSCGSSGKTAGKLPCSECRMRKPSAL